MPNIFDLKETLTKKIEELNFFRLNELVELSGDDTDNILVAKKLKAAKRFYLVYLVLTIILCSSLLVAFFAKEIIEKDIVNWNNAGLAIFLSLSMLASTWSANMQLVRLKTIAFLLDIKSKLE